MISMNIINKLLFLLLVSCQHTDQPSQASKNPVTYANTITVKELKENLYEIASDEYAGRNTGEEGQKKAAEFLKDHYEKNNILSPIGQGDYFQEIPISFLPQGINATENVVSFIEGSEFSDEIIVISAHYDHIGTEGELIYNGADDNASGTVAILEIAEAFQLAKEAGYGPKRSLLFLHVTAEEKGLYGSRWYVENPLFPLENHVVNLNIDMIGRVDSIHNENPNYIYLIGSDRLSTELHQISEETNKTFGNLALDYTYNAPDDPNRFYYRSDHYNFAKNNIPVIFYFNGVHEDYHQATDTAEKINYDLLCKRTKLIFHTTWEIANRKNKPFVDKQ